MLLRVMGNISCDHNLKVKGQIMYFIVNVSPSQQFGVATSDFTDT